MSQPTPVTISTTPQGSEEIDHDKLVETLDYIRRIDAHLGRMDAEGRLRPDSAGTRR